MAKDNGTVKLATLVTPSTHQFLRLESLRRRLTMGQLLDELVQSLPSAVSNSISF